jgi:hypothetical protein
MPPPPSSVGAQRLREFIVLAADELGSNAAAIKFRKNAHQIVAAVR